MKSTNYIIVKKMLDTFSEFLMSDLFLPSSAASSSSEQRCSDISHVSSQMDLSNPIYNTKAQETNSFKITYSSEYNRNNAILASEEVKVFLSIRLATKFLRPFFIFIKIL